jgi:hypothetical protein
VFEGACIEPACPAVDDRWWQIMNFIQLNQFMTARGYSFFLACFYVLFIGLLVSVAVSIWVGISFQSNRFEYVWPIIFIRWFAKIFYQIFDVGAELVMCSYPCVAHVQP